MSKIGQWFLGQCEAGRIHSKHNGDFTMSPIKIDKDVPLPLKPAPTPDMPLAELEVGHSFVLKNIDDKAKAAIRQKMTRYQNSNPPVRLSMQSTRENLGQLDTWVIRIFRTEDKDI